MSTNTSQSLTQDGRARSLAALGVPEAIAARRTVVRQLAQSFRVCGRQLRTCGVILGPGRVTGASPFGNGQDLLVSLGYLSEAAYALLAGTEALLCEDNAYAAAALLRQLVEVEYLMWAFAENEQEAALWLRSSKEERLKRWQPRHLRDRSQGVFRSQDYGCHCEIGGHPTPEGFRSLLEPKGDGASMLDLEWLDSANHAARAWRYLLAAVARTNDTLSVMPAADLARANEAVSVWKQVDGAINLLAPS